MTDKFLEQKFKELLYTLGEIDFKVLTPKAWDEYINNNNPFNKKQLGEFRQFINYFNNEVDEYAKRSSVQTKFVDSTKQFKTIKEYNFLITMAKGDVVTFEEKDYSVRMNLLDIGRNTMKVILKPVSYHTDE